MFKVLQYCNPASVEHLMSSLEERDMMIKERDRLIERQRHYIKKLKIDKDKFTAQHKYEQEHRLRFESQVVDLTLQAEEHKATLEKLKDAAGLHNTNLTQKQRIDNLEDEKKELQLTSDRFQIVMKSLEDRILQNEKQISGLRDEKAYLETRNLDFRDELVAKDRNYHREIEGTASHYKSRLGPYERAIEILHTLSQHDGEELSVAAYFTRALKLKGLQLETVGIDEHRADRLFEHARNGQDLYSGFQPPQSERGFRCEHGPNLPTVPVPYSAQAVTFEPMPVAPTSDTQQLTFALDQSLSGGQTAQFGAPNDKSNGQPPPPFSAEIMDNRRDYKNVESPFFVDFNGNYLDEKAAKQADQQIKAWKKKVKNREKEQAKRNTGNTAGPSNSNVQLPAGTQFENASEPQQTGSTMFTVPSSNSTASAALSVQNQIAQQQPSSLASTGPVSNPIHTATFGEPTFSFPPPSTDPGLSNQTQGSLGQPAQQMGQSSTFGQPQQSSFSILGQSVQQQPQPPHDSSTNFSTRLNPPPSTSAASNQTQAPNQATGSSGIFMPPQNPIARNNTSSTNYRVSRVDGDVDMM
ncbi:hypothetical protein N0V95_002349 [Ascochyta clinopodiicola]|nr:hypothetical protein N0V95_002349 [Ascochyta clinopodiicola]